MDDKPYRVLLVDDEAGIRKIIRLFLEREGYEVHEAVSGAQAKQLIEEKKPHLILLDVILCGMTGFEVCEWIKKNPGTKDIIVILFTALNQDYDYKEGQRVKCDYYLTKPQNPIDIIKKINEFLNKKET
jgi:CheY-like chemotaxis protein